MRGESHFGTVGAKSPFRPQYGLKQRPANRLVSGLAYILLPARQFGVQNSKSAHMALIRIPAVIPHQEQPSSAVQEAHIVALPDTGEGQEGAGFGGVHFRVSVAGSL